MSQKCSMGTWRVSATFHWVDSEGSRTVPKVFKGFQGVPGLFYERQEVPRSIRGNRMRFKGFWGYSMMFQRRTSGSQGVLATLQWCSRGVFLETYT